MKKVLLISHNASLSGAPKLLLNLAQFFNEELDIKTDFILKNDGPLESQFNSKGEVFLLIKDKIRQPFIKRLINSVKIKHNEELDRVDWSSYDFIISNTIANADILHQIRARFKGKIYSYIHELKVVKDYFLNRNLESELISCSDSFLAPCSIVRDFLVDEFNITPNLIKVLPYYIPYSIQSANISPKKYEDFVVGGCGTIELRKGTDLFIHTAALFKAKFPDIPIKFIWKGANFHSLDYMFLAEDIKKLNLEDTVFIEMASTDMDEFYSGLDVFLLTSREDPYPLVILEAANFMVPTICFDKAGGAVEFIGSEAGKVVSYLNLEVVVENIFIYYSNSNKKIKDGNHAKERLYHLHQNKTKLKDNALNLFYNES